MLIYVCDDQHLPSAVFTPINQHSRRLSVLESQLALSKPYQKQLWQQIICQKIANQAKCLELCGKDAQPLYAMVREVRSGDTTNVEATAAVYYFTTLFGQDFVRRDGQLINGALNYGYSLLRGLVARALAIYGFEPSLGLHHHNALNALDVYKRQPEGGTHHAGGDGLADEFIAGGGDQDDEDTLAFQIQMSHLFRRQAEARVDGGQ